MWIGLVRQYVDILLFPFHSVSRSVGLQVTPPFQTSLKGGTGELAWGRVPIGAERWLTPIHRNGCSAGFYFLKCQINWLHDASCIQRTTWNNWGASGNSCWIGGIAVIVIDMYIYVLMPQAGEEAVQVAETATTITATTAATAFHCHLMLQVDETELPVTSSRTLMPTQPTILASQLILKSLPIGVLFS